jgi:hypothetical protein
VLCANFKRYWAINSVSIYQLPQDMPTTTTPTPPSQRDACNFGGTASSSAAYSSAAYSSASVSSSVAVPSSTAASSTSAAVASSTGLPTILGYTYYGCVVDPNYVRLLYADHYVTDPMSVEICAAFCSSGDYTVFGVEYGRECENIPIRLYLSSLVLY